MARSNEDIAAELDRLSTSLSGPRAGALQRIAGELRGDSTTVEATPNESRQAARAARGTTTDSGQVTTS